MRNGSVAIRTIGSLCLEDWPPCDRCKQLPSVLHCDSQDVLCSQCVKQWSMGLRSLAATKARAEQKTRLEHSKAVVREFLYWQLTSKVQGWDFRNAVREIVGLERYTESLRWLKMVEAQRGDGGG